MSRVPGANRWNFDWWNYDGRVTPSHRADPRPSPAPHADPAALAALRQDLVDADYTVQQLGEIVGPVAIAALGREQGLPALDAARASSAPAAALMRLLTLGEQVTRRELDRALARSGTEGALRLGLVAAAGSGPDDGVRALVDLRPVDVGPGGLWLASDLGESVTNQAVHPEHVLGLGAAGRTLAELTVRAPVARVLDVGTGCGIQALQIASFAEQVVGTDISSRALDYAAFNAGLNEVAADLRRGDMLAPVAGERFDLIVSNPPFVITPRAPSGESLDGAAGQVLGGALPSAPLPRFTYRDGGRSGDGLLADLVGQVGAHLTPGGVAQLLANWEIPRGGHWSEHVRDWLDGTGLEAWVIQREATDPAQYAETWLRDGGLTPERDPARWQQAYRAYLADFASRDTEAIGFGYLILRRGPEQGAPWRRFEELTARLPPAPHHAIAHTLAAQQHLVGAGQILPGERLLAERLVVAADVTEERHYRPGQPDPEVVLLHQGGQLGRSVRVGSNTAAVVGACDGELTLEQITTAVGVLTDAEPAQVRAEVLPVLADLFLDGFLTTS